MGWWWRQNSGIIILVVAIDERFDGKVGEFVGMGVVMHVRVVRGGGNFRNCGIFHIFLKFSGILRL